MKALQAACLRPLFIDRNTAMNLQKFARHPLAFGPSPITLPNRLSAHLGGKVHLYAKREDCNSGLAFGGNQTRQVAAVAAHLGLKCVLVQENWVKYSDAVCEGKSMHGMIDRVRKGEFPEGSRVLYAYLGVVPTRNAYSFLFRTG